MQAFENFLCWFFGLPEEKIEPDGRTRYNLHDNDVLWSVELSVFFISLVVFVINFLYTVFCEEVILPWQTTAGVASFLGLLAIAIAFPAFAVGKPTELVIRIFLAGPKYFLRSRYFRIPGLTTVVTIPGDKLILKTADRPGQPLSVTSMVSLGTKYGSIAGATKATKLFFSLKLVVRIDVYNMAETVVQTFYRDFEQSHGNGISKVTSEVLEIVAARADEELQLHELEQYLENVAVMNVELANRLRAPLEAIGITIVQVTIEDIQDEKPGGPLEAIRRAIDAEAASSATQRQAVADGAARVVQAQQATLAGVAEQDARRQVFVAEAAAQAQRVLAEEQAALAKLQPLKQEMALMKGQGAQVLLAKISQLPPTDTTAVLKAFAEAISMKPTTLVSLGDILNAHGVTAVTNALQKLFPGAFPPSP